MADRRSAHAFGAVLKRHRQAAGMTQEELAEMAGLARHTIGTFERGVRRPGLDTLLELGIGLGMRPGILLDETAALLVDLDGGSALLVGSST